MESGASTVLTMTSGASSLLTMETGESVVQTIETGSSTVETMESGASEVLPKEYVSTKTKVLLKDVHGLFKCFACGFAPLLPPVFCCRRGHFACGDCRDDQTQCTECNESLSNRNLPLEDILTTALSEEPKDLMKPVLDGKKEDVSVVAWRRADAVEQLGTVVANDCHDQMLAGGRSVQCPFPCNVRVTATSLYGHFVFHHADVLVVMLCKNRPCSLAIPHDKIWSLDERHPARCFYMFVVDIGDEEQNGEEKLTALNNLSAAEVLNISHSMKYLLRCQKYIAMLSLSRLSGVDAYSAYVTSLYAFSPVRYTLRYSSGKNCVSYQGRPKNLHLPVDPHECLVLQSGLLRKNCSEDLEFTVVFHLDLPFPQGYPDVEPSSFDPSSCDLLNLVI